jgi:hypothetical protein
MRKTSGALIMILLVCAGASAAETLLQYEHRVKRAAEQVERIRKDRSYTSEGIPYVRELLPKYEQIDYEGQLVTVDNTWLHTLLDSYEATGATVNSAKLNEIDGRLRALDERLIEAEAAESKSQVSVEKAGALRDILSRSEYKPRPEDPLTIFLRNIKNKIYDVVTRVLRSLGRSAVGAALGLGWVEEGLIVIVLAAVLVIVVRILMNMNFKGKKRTSRRILGEEIAANLTAVDIAGSAMSAARAGDFRTGIRRLYIACLYQLADKGLIDLDSNATNRDYFRLVSRHSILSNPMEYLTERFDYFWYGKYPATSQDFEDYLSRYGVISDRARSVTG